jgi:hypothetical protein
VLGELSESWSEWEGKMTVVIEYEDDGSPVTTLTGEVDQAALQGLMRRLYSLGKPLISVSWIERDKSPDHKSKWTKTWDFSNNGWVPETVLQIGFYIPSVRPKTPAALLRCRIAAGVVDR